MNRGGNEIIGWKKWASMGAFEKVGPNKCIDDKIVEHVHMS